jgi:phosphate starvation-inducible PhoH-like protein
MAKKAQARRLANQQRQPETKRERQNRNRSSKRKSYQEAPNIVELNAQYHQLNTAYSPQRSREPFKPRTESQQRYVQAIKQHCLTFGAGPAGTGKSYCAAALAAEAMESGRIEQIILTRPAVEAGESLGFLPGSVDDKFSVYIDAFRDILNERLGSGAVEYALRHDRIVAAPLAFMRGKTFGRNTFVVLDEAQNTTPAQMKMFLTRIGEGCKVVINGDVAQSDIRGPNGLADAIERVRGLPDVYIHHFERADIVRSGLVRLLIDRYE